MISASQIREHMPVVGSDGAPVGTVDHCEDERIKLTRNDPQSGGRHHYLMMDDVDRVDGDRICLKMPAQQAMQRWQDA